MILVVLINIEMNLRGVFPFIKEADLNYPPDYGEPALGYYQNKQIKKQIATLRKEAEDQRSF